jgi:carbon starvation protein
MVKNVYLNPAASGYSVLNAALSIVMLVLGIIILVMAVKKWIQLLNAPRLQLEAMSA